MVRFHPSYFSLNTKPFAMTEKLVVLSDMWGAKKGLWIASYFGYLQQYYDIVFYDSQQLGGVDVPLNTEENVHQAFLDGGIDTAVAQLLRKETQAAHYLAFGIGGSIGYRAALAGLPMKSLMAISAVDIQAEGQRPNVPLKLIFGAQDAKRPSAQWTAEVGVQLELAPHFGHGLYTDEKIISDICLELLESVIQKKAV